MGEQKGKEARVCNPVTKFPLLQSWIISHARLCTGNQYFEKFSFNLSHKNPSDTLSKILKTPGNSYCLSTGTCY